jgi:ketosteroid isomerase-like protein
MAQSSTRSARETIDLYYKYANAGDWDRWCDLFTADVIMDEQMAGHIVGQSILREMMKGFPAMYRSFQNVPRHIITSGTEGAVVSDISAVNAQGKSIKAGAMNYFRFEGDRIAYMANFHDTKPFTG